MARGLDVVTFVSEVMDSSSSDDDSMINILNSYSGVQRPKITTYINVISEYSDEEFKRNFRLTRPTFTYLKEIFTESEFSKCQQGGTPRIPVDVQLLAFLWYSGNKAVLRDVAGRFGIAESTLHVSNENVMNFLNKIAKRFIKFPSTHEEKESVAEQFKTISGFPGVLGCIDGTYIPIKTPAGKIKSTYVNRHDQPSITLQAICDANKLFLDVFTGMSSKIHDARIFKLSFISKGLKNICGDEYHILGDAAYPLKPWLITPYRDYGNLTEAQQNFNFKFSATRVKIENSFGLLKQRFRQLHRIDFWKVSKISKFIISSCVLHNLCLMNGDEWEYDPFDIEGEVMHFDEANVEHRSQQQEKTMGEIKRNLLSQQLLN